MSQETANHIPNQLKGNSVINRNIVLEAKQKSQKSQNLREAFRDQNGAIDLASIMVGIVVIGLIGGIIAATVFAIIPWVQDNAAKQQLSSIAAAESAYMGLSSAVPMALPAGSTVNSFGNSPQLASANLMQTGTTYCVSTPDDKSYVAFSRSATGKIWSVTHQNSNPVILTSTLPTDCQFIAPYVDPTPTKTILTYKCDTAVSSGAIPMKNSLNGTETWSDGGNQSYNGSSRAAARSFAAGVTYTVTFDGTYVEMNAFSSTDTQALAPCLRSVDHWGSNSGITNAYAAFQFSSNLTSVPAHIPTTITDMSHMFSNATKFNDPNVSKWDVSNVIKMQNMFANASIFNQSLNNWNTSKVTDMSLMFYSASIFNQPLDHWNTSNVTNMSTMFWNASNFNQPLNNWDTSKVTSMRSMLSYSIFNQPVDKWNTSNVTDMSGMFWSASSFNQPLNTWDVSKVKDMSFMFNSATKFNQPLDNWKTLSVTNMERMFGTATVFNQPLNTWNTSQVTSMKYMFWRANAYNLPLNTWDVSKVTDMSFMFYQNSTFIQNLSGWQTTNVTLGSSFAPSTFPAEYLPPKTARY